MNIFQGIFKYGTETFFVMTLNKFQLVLGSDLVEYSQRQDLFSNEIPCNIYFILKRAKITVDPDSVKITGKRVALNFLVQIKDSYKVFVNSFTLKKATSGLKFLSEYPYNLFGFFDDNGPLLVARPCSLIDSSQFAGKNKSIELDYEVLYIGQAYGKDGKRTALDRLASHETLQQIYADSISRNPDCDISIMLTNFSQISLLVSTGEKIIKVNPTDKKSEQDKIDDIFQNNGLKFTDRQKINFTEAALIRYFEPYYNMSYKTTFPNSNHKTYSECYDLDVRAMAIELDTSEMKRKIFSEKSGRKTRHFQSFEFNSFDDRYNLFNLTK